MNRLSFVAGLLLIATLAGAAETTMKNPVSTAALELKGVDDFQVLSRGGQAGPYAAFPDATRLKSGDIKAVFYSGYGHVSLPREDWPKGGFICTVSSKDEGRTWTEPKVLFDDGRDNRDPHIAELSDGTQLVTFFSLMPKTSATKSGSYESSHTELLVSHDGGATWDGPRVIAKGWYVSAPVREL